MESAVDIRYVPGYRVLRHRIYHTQPAVLQVHTPQQGKDRGVQEKACMHYHGYHYGNLCHHTGTGNQQL